LNWVSLQSIRSETLYRLVEFCRIRSKLINPFASFELVFIAIDSIKSVVSIGRVRLSNSLRSSWCPMQSNRFHRLVEFASIRSDSIKLDRVRFSNSIRPKWFSLHSIRSNGFHRFLEFGRSRLSISVRSNLFSLQSIRSERFYRSVNFDGIRCDSRAPRAQKASRTGFGEPFGRILAAFGSILGAILKHCDANEAFLEAIQMFTEFWIILEAIWEQFGRHLQRFGLLWGHLGTLGVHFWDASKFHRVWKRSGSSGGEAHVLSVQCRKVIMRFRVLRK